MKQILTLLAFGAYLFYANPTLAQTKRAKFGKATESEIEMRVFAGDTSAAAVILSDFGSSRFIFNSEVQLVFERQMRIKILKKSGYSWADIEVPYYHKGTDRERVSNIKGYTYNLENGKVIKDKFEAKATFDEQRSENWSIKKFTMPNVKEGSVIDISYSVTSDFIYNLRDWEFQTSVPTVWSEYQALIPEYYDYKFLQQGYQKIYTPTELGLPHVVSREGYRWIAKDVPALKEERYITTLQDYVAKIEFELEQVKYPGQSAKVMTSTWSKAVTDLMESLHFGRQLNRKGFFKDQVSFITTAHSDQNKQMEAIYNLVKSTMSWDGKYGIWTNGPIKKAFENKKGSVAEINLMLTAMLQDAGMDASPVLISTRSHGKPYKGTPLLNKFNYVITHVKVNGKDFLLDATDPLLPIGLLPERSLNGEGYLVHKESARWIPLTPAKLFAKSVLMNITIEKDGSLVGKGTESVDGYSALRARREILEEGKEKFIQGLGRESGDFKISNHTIENLDQLDKSLNITYEIKGDGKNEMVSILYLNPVLGFGEKENPFKLYERSYPVDFGAPHDETIICNYTIPAGWLLDEAPKPVKVALPDNGGSFTFLIRQEGNVLQVMSKVSITKSIYNPNEYPALKEVFSQVMAKQAEQIVLKKQL